MSGAWPNRLCPFPQSPPPSASDPTPAPGDFSIALLSPSLRFGSPIVQILNQTGQQDYVFGDFLKGKTMVKEFIVLGCVFWASVSCFDEFQFSFMMATSYPGRPDVVVRRTSRYMTGK